MPSADYDLHYLQAGIDLLENYLLSTEIYWPIGIHAPRGAMPYPQMTLGTLLLVSQRAPAAAHTPSDLAELQRLSIQLEATHSHWRTAWSKKAAAEFRARLTLWRDFLEEYRKNPDNNYDRYAYEVERRVMLHLLAEDADSLPQEQQDLLTGLDLVLQAVLIPGEFIWEKELQPRFLHETYWYLYGQLPQK